MELYRRGVAKRLILSLAAGASLGGCVVAPPYAAYDPAYGAAAPGAAYYYPYNYYPYTYGYPAYVGPPLSLSFGYTRHRYGGGRGWGGGHGWGGGRGGWRGRR